MSKDQYLISKAQASLKQKVKDPEFMTAAGTSLAGSGAAIHSIYTMKPEDAERMGRSAARNKWRGGIKGLELSRYKNGTPNLAQRAARKTGRAVGFVGGTIAGAPTKYKAGLAVGAAAGVGSQLANRRLVRESKKG